MVERISKYLDTAFPIFFFLMAVSFYLRTYDSAMVKITELQMFGTILIAIWLCKVFESGHWPFKKNQTLIVLPFLAIFASGILSFIRSPLHWGSFDFFVRRVMYVGIAMIAATEMTSLHDFRRITKWLIAAVAVCTIYGLIQWVDVHYFPPGPPTIGLDKFVWRHAFGERIFSTFGNPNFYSNFLVIMVPVMMAHYLRTRQFYLIPLIILTLVNAYWTGSKGPAAGLIASTGVFSFLILRFFFSNAKIRKIIFVGAFAVMVLLGGYIINRVFFAGGITSFTFRIYTWLSTWEMINAKPVLGNGIGTFWVLYPAYRRPAIFHIEGKHNTETDHAENEHLEVWMDEGIVGAGLWIWMILTISIGLYKTLQVLTSQPARAGPQSRQEQKIPEECYYILGFLSGFLGMLMHNFTDVSMRFVSSGTPFWLLAGMNAALLMYSPLPDHQEPLPSLPGKTPPESKNLKYYVKLGLRAVTILCIAIVAIRILREFDWCQGRDAMRNPNEFPHFTISWGVFLLCWGSAAWWFFKIAKDCTRLKTLITILTALFILVPFWGIFVGDVNHNRAIFFSKQGVWTRGPEFDSKIAGFPPEYQIMYLGSGRGSMDKDFNEDKLIRFLFPDVFWRQYGIGGALEHYAEVNRLRPDFIMAYYFEGNVYNDWGSNYAQKTQEAFQKGDVAQGEIFRKKAEEYWIKALDAYTATRKLGPNYVQMHHQAGTVHQKWGDFLHLLAPLAEKYGKKDLAQEYYKNGKEHWLTALQFYQLYYKIDPVYDQNFYRSAQIYIQLGELDKAEQTYLDHIEAKECKKPYHQVFGGFYIKGLRADNSRYDLASPEHTHDIVINAKPESWIILGDFYSFVKPSPEKAENAYKRAVQLWPENIDFLKRLASFYGRVGKNQQAVETWQKVYKLNPSDPDLQKVIQIQPK